MGTSGVLSLCPKKGLDGLYNRVSSLFVCKLRTSDDDDSDEIDLDDDEVPAQHRTIPVV